MVYVQKSFQNDEAKLYIVPTPIGNLDDMTFRAVETLKKVDKIACEDTRQTQKLLNHFQIQTPVISYHEHNKYDREEMIISMLKEGQSLALVSDAGMPMISDPGFELVRRCRDERIDVITLPGANAALTALVGSGLNTDLFTFFGFLPRKKNEQIQVLTELSQHEGTLIFYESPYRVKKTLTVMKETYSDDRQVTLARELTKKYEEYIHGTLKDVINWIESNDIEMRGEFCIILEGRKEFTLLEDDWWIDKTIIEHVDYYIESEQLSKNEAIKKVAKDRKVAKREIYQTYHRLSH